MSQGLAQLIHKILGAKTFQDDLRKLSFVSLIIEA